MVTPSGPPSDYLPPMNLVGMSARIRSKSGTRFLADRTTLRPSPLVYGKISGRNPSSLLVLVVKGYRRMVKWWFQVDLTIKMLIVIINLKQNVKKTLLVSTVLIAQIT